MSPGEGYAGQLWTFCLPLAGLKSRQLRAGVRASGSPEASNPTARLRRHVALGRWVSVWRTRPLTTSLNGRAFLWTP